MSMSSPVKSVSESPRIKLGFYAYVSGKEMPASVPMSNFDDTDHEFRLHNLLKDAHTLRSLTPKDLAGVRCIIVDIRQNARQALIACRDAASRYPIIVLADADQTFSEYYPYGTYVSDVTNTFELGRSVFWHRVDRAVGYYEKPLSVNDTNNPVHSVFKSIADQTSDWIIIKDLQHRFVVAGENFAATAGTPIDKIIGRDDLEIGSSKDAVHGNPETGEIGFWAQDEAVTNNARATVEENPEWLLYSRKARYRRTYRVPLTNPPVMFSHCLSVLRISLSSYVMSSS
ncbi:MAG: hypothetical protein AB8B87_03955 [Granulosicoccus sp.]